MIHKIPKDNMYVSNHGWLESRFHFSFDEYRDIKNTNFGVLRVLNSDIIKPQSGFDTHPHKNMEIISYIIEGEITHKDSMGNERRLKRGEVQYMSAGAGVLHSEHNNSSINDLRLLQIWILPPKDGLSSIYGEEKYSEEESNNKLLHIVSSKEGNSKVKIHQDVNIYVSQLENNQSVAFNINKNRQIYFVQIEGASIINDITLNQEDAAKITNESKLHIKAIGASHFLFIEMEETK